ncbi:hypothetical protein MUO98_02395, partial [Candidatus Bathyarchaeota archaeon]|nr:hypothetical protein [Candidatus Bathyarchaeota archaeon]
TAWTVTMTPYGGNLPILHSLFFREQSYNKTTFSSYFNQAQIIEKCTPYGAGVLLYFHTLLILPENG